MINDNDNINSDKHEKAFQLIYFSNLSNKMEDTHRK
jgi:hypothetical protein